MHLDCAGSTLGAARTTETLVEAAYTAGGRDNITAVLVRVLPS